MKKLATLVLLLVSPVLPAQDEKPSAEQVQQLAVAMGLEQLLQATMNQVAESLQQSSGEIVLQMKEQLPPMTREQEEEMRGIFEKHMTAVVRSVDVQEAARIYTSVLAENLSQREVSGAILYYGSDDGRKVLRAVAQAGKAMNQYILETQNRMVQETQPVMFQELRTFAQGLQQAPGN